MARLRVQFEHRFATLKQPLGSRRMGYRGLIGNAFDFALTITACNMKRSLSL